MPTATQAADHVCDQCGDQFDSRRALVRHVREQGLVV
jgi:hypothetical protein